MVLEDVDTVQGGGGGGGEKLHTELPIHKTRGSINL